MNKAVLKEIEEKKNILKDSFCSGTDILINDWQKMTKKQLKKELISLRKSVDLSNDPVNRQFFEIGNLIYKANFNRELTC